MSHFMVKVVCNLEVFNQKRVLINTITEHENPFSFSAAQLIWQSYSVARGEVVSQTKYCCSLKEKRFGPQIFFAGYAIDCNYRPTFFTRSLKKSLMSYANI